ncbi:MAG TPA: LamB/YcsF family protein, partial [Reyranella sp.]
MAATNAGFVNINSDLGESFGPWKMGNDAEILKIVRTANVACGFHGGDPTVMVETVRLCVENGVSIGAHPGFADLQGFGRREIKLTLAELEANIAYQLGALQAIAALRGGKVTHMKPHGMMANMSAEDADMSDAIARATKAVDRDIIFL